MLLTVNDLKRTLASLATIVSLTMYKL
jgi:hypothetical protein